MAWQKLRECLISTAWAVPMAIAFADCIGTVIKVEGASMQPTFNAEANHSSWVLVEKLTCKWLHDYERGSVVVLWAPDDPKQQLIKRIVGLPGDYVRVAETGEIVKVPQGRCWIEGDNAARSGDSRNLYGPVHLGLLEGKVMYRVWPPSQWGVMRAHVPAGKLVQEDVASI